MSRLDGREGGVRGSLADQKSLRGRAVSSSVSEPRTHANQTGPTTHMQPAAVATHPASPPARLQPLTSQPLQPSPVNHQSSATTTLLRQNSIAGADARAWCLDPDTLLDLSWDMNLGRLQIGTANTSQFLSECTQSQSESAWDISFVGCRQPIATTQSPRPSIATITARLDLTCTLRPNFCQPPPPRAPAHSDRTARRRPK